MNRKYLTGPTHCEFRMKSLLYGLLVLVAAVSIGYGATSSSSASAYVANGCKFAGSDPAIRYHLQGVGTTWTNSFNRGQADWDFATLNYGGYFIPGTLDNRNIRVRDVYASATWTGLASGGCAEGGGQTWYNDFVDIQFNLRLTPSDSTVRRIVVIHELGHALGLAHRESSCTSPAVMDESGSEAYVECGNSDAPYYDDRLGVSIIY